MTEDADAAVGTPRPRWTDIVLLIYLGTIMTLPMLAGGGLIDISRVYLSVVLAASMMPLALLLIIIKTVGNLDFSFGLPGTRWATLLIAYLGALRSLIPVIVAAKYSASWTVIVPLAPLILLALCMTYVCLAMFLGWRIGPKPRKPRPKPGDIVA